MILQLHKEVLYNQKENKHSYYSLFSLESIYILFKRNKNECAEQSS